MSAQVCEFSSLVGDLVQLSPRGSSAREVLDLHDVVANAVTKA